MCYCPIIVIKNITSDLKRSSSVFEENANDKLADMSRRLDSSMRETEERLGHLEKKVKYNIIDRLDDMAGSVQVIEHSTNKEREENPGEVGQG